MQNNLILHKVQIRSTVLVLVLTYEYTRTYQTQMVFEFGKVNWVQHMVKAI